MLCEISVLVEYFTDYRFKYSTYTMAGKSDHAC